MKYCSSCGAQIADNDLFCKKCGYRFPANNSPEVKQPEPVQIQAGASAPQPQMTQPQNTADAANSKSGKITGLSIAAFILSLLGCTSLIGAILGILDVIKKDGRKKVLSYAAIIIGALFTLISLILIPILIGVLAPKLSEYNEKTNVSADMELAEQISSAISRSQMNEASLINDYDTWLGVYASFSGLQWKNIEDIGTVADHNNTDTVRGCIEDKLGMNLEDVKNHVKSHHTSDMKILYRIEYDRVSVLITTTDKTGKKGIDPDNYICTDPTYGIYESYYEY